MVRVRVQDFGDDLETCYYYWRLFNGVSWYVMQYQEGLLLNIVDEDNNIIATFPPGCWFGVAKEEEFDEQNY